MFQPEHVPVIHKCMQPECKQTFTGTRELILHWRVQHNRELKCPLCPKICTAGITLVHHVRTHTKERPYKCPIAECKYASTTKANLRLHMKAVHGPDTVVMYAGVFGWGERRKRKDAICGGMPGRRRKRSKKNNMMGFNFPCAWPMGAMNGMMPMMGDMNMNMFGDMNMNMMGELGSVMPMGPDGKPMSLPAMPELAIPNGMIPPGIPPVKTEPSEKTASTNPNLARPGEAKAKLLPQMPNFIKGCGLDKMGAFSSMLAQNMKTQKTPGLSKPPTSLQLPNFLQDCMFDPKAMGFSMPNNFPPPMANFILPSPDMKTVKAAPQPMTQIAN